ncbi:26484_t:CDS:10 [Gigaspora margarita]|uniref:26484_t:CDS:1 n=1 Tax=Gigaspora margarita TaxID=4874 RepID=A0ABN7V6Q6_GIGMA|nr:26484_t:CDS:10 [Gigaspora margarita]
MESILLLMILSNYQVDVSPAIAGYSKDFIYINEEEAIDSITPFTLYHQDKLDTIKLNLANLVGINQEHACLNSNVRYLLVKISRINYIWTQSNLDDFLRKSTSNIVSSTTKDLINFFYKSGTHCISEITFGNCVYQIFTDMLEPTLIMQYASELKLASQNPLPNDLKEQFQSILINTTAIGLKLTSLIEYSDSNPLRLEWSITFALMVKQLDSNNHNNEVPSSIDIKYVFNDEYLRNTFFLQINPRMINGIEFLLISMESISHARLNDNNELKIAAKKFVKWIFKFTSTLQNEQDENSIKIQASLELEKEERAFEIYSENYLQIDQALTTIDNQIYNLKYKLDNGKKDMEFSFKKLLSIAIGTIFIAGDLKKIDTISGPMGKIFDKVGNIVTTIQKVNKLVKFLKETETKFSVPTPDYTLSSIMALDWEEELIETFEARVSLLTRQLVKILMDQDKALQYEYFTKPVFLKSYKIDYLLEIASKQDASLIKELKGFPTPSVDLSQLYIHHMVVPSDILSNTGSSGLYFDIPTNKPFFKDYYRIRVNEIQIILKDDSINTRDKKIYFEISTNASLFYNIGYNPNLKEYTKNYYFFDHTQDLLFSRFYDVEKKKYDANMINPNFSDTFVQITPFTGWQICIPRDHSVYNQNLEFLSSTILINVIFKLNVIPVI